MKRLRARRGLETVDVAFPRFVSGGDFGGYYDYLDNPIIMATYRIPVRPLSTRDWHGNTRTISNISIYFPIYAQFDYEKPDPDNPGLFFRIRGREWHIDGDPEVWKFGGMPHIKINARREGTSP